MENPAASPPKTDSLADYSNSVSTTPTISTHTQLTDSDFAFDFGKSTNSDGTIKCSKSDVVANFQKSQIQEPFSKKHQFTEDGGVMMRYMAGSAISENPSGIMKNKSLMSALDGDGDSATIKKCQKEGYSTSVISKFFTRLRISWWLASFVVFFGLSPMLACILFLLQFFMIRSASKIVTKRIIKWSVENFSEEIKKGMMASPPFTDKSGEWCLVIVQKECIDGVQTYFGLIASNLPREVELVKSYIEFTLVNQQGQDLCPGFHSLYLQHSFACVGDCGYTRGITLSSRQLKVHQQLEIKCRIEFERQEIGYLRELYKRFMGVYERDPKNTRNETSLIRTAPTFGFISQQKQSDKNQLTDSIWRGSPTATFVQHPETKTFVWEIPNFQSLLKDSECWGMFSPLLFVNSHDFCSIWRLKFFELMGVFRLHVQLRGLPGDIKQVKTWHLVTLVDNYGDQVVPEDCNPRLKYPDYLNLWDSHRHILYRRETLLDRFVSTKGTVTIRISLQVEPNELVWMEGSSSDGWILA